MCEIIPDPPLGLTADEAAAWRETWVREHPPPVMTEEQRTGWIAAHTRSNPAEPIAYPSISARGTILQRLRSAANQSVETGLRIKPRPNKADVNRWAITEARRRHVCHAEPMSVDQTVAFLMKMYGATEGQARTAHRRIPAPLKRAVGVRNKRR